MWLSDTSVRRPVLATVLSLLLIAFGVLSFQNLPLRELPDVDPPIVSVQTTYIGASASVVENRVTKPIEERLAGIEGIRKIVSESSEGVSQITVEFELSRDIDNAANDVRDRVSMSRDDIPDEADAPEIYKAQSDASPIMWLNLSSPDLDQLELTDYADRRLVDRFSVVDGVARVVLSGAKHYSMRIWLDRIALAARELTVADVETALRQQNVELPAGRIESIERDLTVRVDRGYSSAEDFRALVVKRGDEGQLVRLGDVARVEVGPLESSGGFRGNGHPRLGIGIVKQSTANTVSVANGVIEEVGRVQSSLPPHMLLETGWNSADYVQASVDEVYRTLGIAMVLVVFVIYLFLGTKRAALIPAVTVPICLIATFTGLWAFGLSINLLTLLALILSIGLVVDDSIVVLENVQRRIELGEPPLIAAYRGTREVGFAVIATTLVVIAVFVPIAFLEGTTGRIFRELAVTVSVSVAVSSLVALTLSAMLCSKILARSQPDAGLARFASRVVASSQEAYGRVLEAALRRRGVIVAIVVATVALAGWLVGLVPRELEPKEDRGAFMIFMQAPEGASFEYTDAHMKMLEEQVLFPLVDEGAIEFVLTRVPFGYTTDTSMNTGMVITVMAPWGERDVTVDQVMARVAAEASAIPGVIAFPISPSTLGRSTSSRPVQLVVGGSRHEEVGAWQEQVIAEASERVPSVRGLLGSYRPTQPQLRVEVDRDRAADLGVAVAVVGRTLETMLGSARVTTYEDRGEEYEVVLQAEAAQRASPTDLTNLYVRSDRSGLLIPLSNLVRITERADAGKLRRFNRLPAATIEASLAPGVSLGDGLHDLETMARQILPEDAHFDYDGDSLEFVESSSAAYFTFLLALLIVFLVLAAQFESFVHPAVIMLTVPLAVAGALAGLHLATLGAHAGLWHTTGSLNIYSQIGMTILIGLAAKNGILLVEFTNQLRAQGIAFERAIREAARARLRPILMTGISTALGALPLVLGSGPGSGGRRAIGIVVFAGVLSATFLTLFVVPVAYSFVARRTHTPGELDQALDELDRSTPAVVGLGGELEG